MAGVSPPEYVQVDLATLEKICSEHCPVFYLHHTDAYLPCTAEYFMQHSALSVRKGKHVHVLIPRGQVDGLQLLARQREFDGDEGTRKKVTPFFLDLDPAARAGMPPEQLAAVPIYVLPKAVEMHTNGQPRILEISYITLYAFNGPYFHDITGHHDGDWEHLTVRVLWPSGLLVGVWYNAHRSRDGQWVGAEAVPRRSDDGRLVAYVARHGHGTYPRAGTVRRHFGFGNDHMSDRGHHWDPEKIVLLPSGLEFESKTTTQIPVGEEGATNGRIESRAMRSIRVCASRGSKLREPSPPPAEQTPSKTEGKVPAVLQPRPRVITTDSCPWVGFRARWGTTDAPITQCWYKRAEPPISRTPLERLFWHFGPEIERV